MDNPVYIFDLDGTLLSVNSYRNWVKYLMRGKFPKVGPYMRLKFAWRVVLLMVLRKLGILSHVTSKRLMQLIWTTLLARDPQQGALQMFNESLIALLRPNMKEALGQLQARGADCILATAAAAEYADDLGQRLGFKHILTTPPISREGPENVRERKRDNVLAYLAAQGWDKRPRVFFTDHEEDLPLIRESQRVYWLGEDSTLPSVAGVELLASREKPILGL